MTKVIWDFIINFIPILSESVVAFYLFGSLLTRRSHFQKSHLAFILPVVLNAVLINFISPLDPIMKLFLFIAILLGLMVILFKENLLILSFFAILLEYVLIMSDLLIGNFLSLLAQNSAILFFDSEILVYFIKFLNLAMAWLLIRVLKPLDFDIDKKYWLYLNIITLTFMVISVCYVALYPTLELTRSKMIIFFVLTLSFFLVSCFVIYFFILICRFFQKEQNHYVTQLANNSLQQQLMLQESMAESTKKFRHNFQNNLLNISYFLSNSQYEDAKKYVDELCAQFNQIPSIINSGNSILDAVLNCKAIAAEKHGIKLSIDIKGLPSLEMAYTDLASILSNLLDNAIEACQTLPEDKRVITLKISLVKNYVNIILQNYYTHVLKTDNNFYATTKTDPGLHGYGLKLIQDAVLRNRGYFECTAESNEFTASVLLPLAQ